MKAKKVFRDLYLLFQIIKNIPMANRRKRVDGCTGHNITLCEENKAAVLLVLAEIERKHQSSIGEAVNRIISEWVVLSAEKA